MGRSTKINGEAIEHWSSGSLQAYSPIAPGTYVVPSVAKIIRLVAQQAGLSVEAIRGTGRSTSLVNARFCISALTLEFCGHLAACTIDDAMLRGSGVVVWQRDRHKDRLKLYEDYAELHQRCRQLAIDMGIGRL